MVARRGVGPRNRRRGPGRPGAGGLRERRARHGAGARGPDDRGADGDGAHQPGDPHRRGPHQGGRAGGRGGGARPARRARHRSAQRDRATGADRLPHAHHVRPGRLLQAAVPHQPDRRGGAGAYLRQADAGRRVHHGAERRRGRVHRRGASQRDQRGRDPGAAHAGVHHAALRHRRPRRRERDVALSAFRRVLRDRQRRGSDPGEDPVRGEVRGGPDQGAGERGRVVGRGVGGGATVLAGGAQRLGRGSRHVGAQGGRARARSGGDQARRSCRRRLDRARQPDRRRGDSPHEGARHVPGRRHLQRRLHHRRVHPARLPAEDHRQGAAGRAAAARELQEGGAGRCEDRVRHRCRGVSPRLERQAVRPHGPLGDDADAGDPGGHRQRGRLARLVGQGGHARAGQVRRCDRRDGRSAPGRHGARARGVRDEGRTGGEGQPDGRRENRPLTLLITVHKERSMLRTLRLALLLLAGAALAASAQETASDTLLTVDHYLDWEQVADPQISPDGSQIVYTRRWVNKIEDKWEAALWIMNADGSHQRFLVKGSDARWSPDGTRILYLADGEPKGTQVFVRWMDAEGATSQITQVTMTPASLRWSPDGKQLSFAMLVAQADTWKISLPPSPKGAKWTPPPRMVDRLHYRQDRRGFMEGGFTHLFLVPADGGTPRQLTRGAWNVGARFDGLDGGVGYDWTPDGKTIVFDGLNDPNADYSYRGSHIYALDVGSGTIRQLTSRPGRWANPVVSPDGRSVAFTGYDSTSQTYKAAGLWTMGIDGSGMRDLSGDLDRDPGDLEWAPDGSGIYFTAGDRGTSNVRFAALKGGGARQVTEGVQMLSLSSLARDFTAVGTRSDFEHPADVVRYNLR